MASPLETPGQTVGPFFHCALPYDGDSRLVSDAHVGAVRLYGTVYDGAGQAVPDALVELWQPDPDGNIVQRPGSLRRDGSTFTGWGRSATDSAGRYSFTTVAPGSPSAGRPAFFALTVFARGLLNRLFTRAYLPGGDFGADPLLAGLDAARRQTLICIGEAGATYRFDIHLQGVDETVFLAYGGDRR
ncbi:protocatechuate 3,4-dioxygenase subunit alpha [Mycobacterium xenopi]|uniref:Protocatechuate 3,4-dioxygenase subunit alpha n=1 Tax=Mycobacterium xenopi TaxID=1789 RepID=A0AAD1M1M8_MYCXE|nr:protocatechuate 3,4-dioxygenase subunit alpha [Mycobacterium xenopi]MDA3639800.1 protocatechuate 3,4-dioxygenase subunit alpha [Mycobacterium xenopi]MDA3658160.1 protocatechuate 3,4-dioxygenase subunit alpha [Mycobacterium xenopi]MDA3661812.1 protocatechuate 3,4-dioxygenase subunit alpha [Mycobacterium xenopi]ORX21468.1 protocatechuate 3,4-dioxygenase subunit alpha [Mycobacterium xenopi]SPX88892.1 PcaG [Mycobacterium xenopi]